MAASISNTAFISASTTSSSNEARNEQMILMKIIFSLIAISSVVPNVLFLLAMCSNRSRMRGRYHNILLYNMMISDTLAGTTILVTPNVILPEHLVKFPKGLEGEIYCRVLYSQFLLFFFGVVSVYTVVFLSIERWVAVQYPFKYRATITSAKVKVSALFIWLLGLLTNAPHLAESRPWHKMNDSGKPCQWEAYYSTRQLVSFVEIFLKFILPSVVLVSVLLSLYRKVHRQNQSNMRTDREKQLLRMCAATSFVVLLCWSPNQIYYLLYKFGIVKIGTTWHHCTVVIALSTSSINPIIYFVTSTAYRRCLVAFLCKGFRKCWPQEHLARIVPPTENVETKRITRAYSAQTFDSPLFTWKARAQSMEARLKYITT